MKISIKILTVFLILFVDFVNNQCLPYCLACQNPYSCTQCEANQSCCPSSCTSCVNQTKCQQCVPGYQLNATQNICYLSNSCSQINCNGCQAGICANCTIGYYLDVYTYQCFPCAPNCGNCLSYGQCTVCNVGFIANNGYCQTCINNCKYCQNLNTCSICNTGYYVNSQSQCSQCSSPCQTCQNSSTICLSCIQGYGLSSSSSCVNCSQYIPNCQSCNLSSEAASCLQCSPNYYLANPTLCQKCQSYCLQCNATSCLECLPGFFYNSTSSQCMQCPSPGCLLCQGGVCQQCLMGTYLTNTGFCERCLTGCVLCLAVNFCFECQLGYYLKGGLCYPCAAECLGCVQSDFNCINCQPAFYQPNGLGYCILCPYYCETCSSPQNCLSCHSGHYLQQGKCLQCTTENCINCGVVGTNVCSMCASGYFLSNGTCYPCIQNCLVCSNNQTCQTCSGSSVLNSNSTCTLCIENCGLCKSSTLTCQVCVNGYYLNNNTCYSCPIQCSICTNASYCSKCLPHYFSHNGVCSFCSSPCATCSGSSTACTSCLPGYQLKQINTCVPCQIGCLVCDPQQNCYACQRGYAQVKNISSSTQQLYCQACPQNCMFCINSFSSCSTCEPGYTLLSTGQCLPCGSTQQTLGCKTCNSDGSCQTCLNGLTLNSSKQCSAPVIYIYQYQNKGLFIGLISALAVICVLLLIYIGYNLYQMRKANSSAQSLYRMIEMP